MGSKENSKKVGKVSKSASGNKLKQYSYLRDKVKRLVAARNKAKEDARKSAYATAMFRKATPIRHQSNQMGQ